MVSTQPVVCREKYKEAATEGLNAPFRVSMRDSRRYQKQKLTEKHGFKEESMKKEHRLYKSWEMEEKEQREKRSYVAIDINK